MDRIISVQQSKKLLKWILWPYLVAALCVCVFSAILGIMAWRSLGWPVSFGEILSSKIIYDPSSEGESKAQILYKYTVNGRQLHGDRVLWGGTPISGEGLIVAAALDYMRKYPEGKRVDVYYDPYNPAWSVLEPGINRQVGLLMLFGLFLMTLGLAALWRFYHGGLPIPELQEEEKPLQEEWRTVRERGDEESTEALFREIQEKNRLDPMGRFLFQMALLAFIAVIGFIFWPVYHPWLVSSGLLKQPQTTRQVTPGAINGSPSTEPAAPRQEGPSDLKQLPGKMTTQDRETPQDAVVRRWDEHSEAAHRASLHGDYQLSEQQYRLALHHAEKLGPHVVATTCDNLGYVLEKQGRAEEAIPVVRRSLEIRKQVKGDELFLAYSQAQLARLLALTGNREEAEIYYRRSLKTAEEKLGRDHGDVARFLRGYAGFLAEKGRKMAAEELMNRAKRIEAQN